MLIDLESKEKRKKGERGSLLRSGRSKKRKRKKGEKVPYIYGVTLRRYPSPPPSKTSGLILKGKEKGENGRMEKRQAWGDILKTARVISSK